MPCPLLLRPGTGLVTQYPTHCFMWSHSNWETFVHDNKMRSFECRIRAAKCVHSSVRGTFGSPLSRLSLAQHKIDICIVLLCRAEQANAAVGRTTILPNVQGGTKDHKKLESTAIWSDTLGISDHEVQNITVLTFLSVFSPTLLAARAGVSWAHNKRAWFPLTRRAWSARISGHWLGCEYVQGDMNIKRLHQNQTNLLFLFGELGSYLFQEKWIIFKKQNKFVKTKNFNILHLIQHSQIVRYCKNYNFKWTTFKKPMPMFQFY